MLELVGSNTSTHSVDGGNTCRREFIVAWADRLDAAQTLLGSAHPTIPACWCKSVSIEPWPQDAKATGGDLDPLEAEIVYPYAKLTCEYATDPAAQDWPDDIPKPNFRSGTALKLEVQHAAEFLRVPARSTAWSDNTQRYPSGPIPEDDSPAGRLFVAKAEYRIHWLYVDNPPLNTLRGLIGCVNENQWLGGAAETMLFEGFELQPAFKASVDEPFTWTVICKFNYRAILVGQGQQQQTYGWNHEYRLDGWKRVQMYDGTQWTDRYPKKNFSNMFA